MAHSKRTLIVPITAHRRSFGSYPFKLIELINQLNLAQLSFCSDRVVRRLQAFTYRRIPRIVSRRHLHRALIRYTRIVW